MDHSNSRKIEIPLILKKRLKKDDSLFDDVKSSLKKFANWINQSKMIFFPEYTDHGITHIEGVLRTASLLINKDSWKLMTPGDSAMLILSSLLHDSAMHLTEDGFVELISNNKRKIIKGFDDRPWQSLWQDFCREAIRFDGRKLINLFGDPEPAQIPSIEPPRNWTEKQRKLIGEFLRRHHHRLAHEIALYGVPGGTEGKKLKLIGLSDNLLNLAGVIARSHGTSVRSLLEYLKKEYYSEITYKDIHMVFIMVILRISDYLQIQSNRAPKATIQVQRIKSPISSEEWNVHQAIFDVNSIQPDPELIKVIAEPSDVKTYLKLKKLLNDIQSELDSSWAVLGEIYGLYERKNLDKLGLTIRRINSNLNDPNFKEKIKYIPIKASFEAVPDLLKLLIRPLYGDRPEFGIRELIQNAVDAVLELREYRKKTDIKDEDIIQQEADVSILLEKQDDDTWQLVVSDCGIGMTAEVICEYFLKAGASFRKSDAWFKNFTDKDGKSKVLRSGRFGIGILTAFLLGNEIHVSTRYAGSKPEEGIEFSATIDTDIIEIRRIERSIGTTISIKIDNEIAEDLKMDRNKDKWDWYCLDDPKVVRKIKSNDGEKELSQRYHLPACGSELNQDWRQLEATEYQDIHWTYSNAPYLVCNGIIVTQTDSLLPGELSPFNLLERKYEPLSLPKISVFDPDGKLPFNLQRTSITQSDYPFGEQLVRNMTRELIAYMLVNAPNRPFEYIPNYRCSPLDFNSTKTHYQHEFITYPWFYTGQGVSFVDNWHIGNAGIQHILLTANVFYGESNIDEDTLVQELYLKEFDAIFIFYYVWGHKVDFMNSDTWTKFALTGESVLFPNPFNKNKVLGRRLLIDKKHINKIKKYIASEEISIEEEYKTEKWSIYQTGTCPQDSQKYRRIVENITNNNKKTEYPPMIAEWYLNCDEPNEELSPFARVWRDILGSPIIPYDLDKRNEIIAKVYSVLVPYIEDHKILSAEDIKVKCEDIEENT
jgi:molecular chaperone HtpG